MFDLIDKKLAEILDIHLTLAGIHDRYRAVKLHIPVRHRILYGLHDIGQFTHARRLNQHTFRCVSIQHFSQRSTEVTHKRTTDTSGIHFLDLDPRFLQESAVYTDLAKLILNQNDLRIRKSLLQ